MAPLWRDKRAMISLSVIIIFVVGASIGPFIYQHVGGPYRSSLGNTIGPDQYHTFSYREPLRLDDLPSAQYWLGTDSSGHDILARLMQGILVSLLVVIVVEFVDIVLGVTLGVLAGYFGGWIDQFLGRFTDLMLAFPSLLLLILVSAIWGDWTDTYLRTIPVLGQDGNGRLLLISLVQAFTAWPLMARYVRGQTLQLKTQLFVEAARVSGTTQMRIIFRHLMPNLCGIVVITSTLNIPNTIIAEAGLSFLNLGVRDPGSSIGLMIASTSDNLMTHPWEVFVPTVTLTLIVLAFSFLGDSLRDAFDPRSPSPRKRV